MIDLKGNPFYLDDQRAEWVRNTLSGMSLDEKLGQVFIQLAQPDRDYLDEKILGKHVGGVLFRQNSAQVIQDTLRYVQENSKIPVLFCGNMEEGGVGLAREGTYYSKQMETSATGNPVYAYRNGVVTGREGVAMGCYMNFGPVVDMTLEWRSAITATNAYGDDPDLVLRYASANMKGLMESGMGAAVKHFPGEGQDDHDQHYNCEVNEMSMSEWDACFGKVFQGLIDQGALSIMPGHIALPSYQAHFNPETAGKLLPATFSKELLTDLLRGKLGFNGLIISDNTCIAGCSNYLPRSEAVPQMLAAGIDLILYSFGMDEDVGFLKDALADGRLTMERLDEAVERNLAAKAALRLPEKKEAGTLVPGPEALSAVGCEEHQRFAKECADRAVTLVKDTQNALPLTAERYPRVLLTLICDPWEREHMERYIAQKLEQKGFAVTVSDPKEPMPADNSVGAWKRKYDLFLYVARQESAHKDKTSLRINWPQAGNVPRFTSDIPAVYVSMGNPFDLYDVPMMKTYVNAYCGTDTVIDAVLAKLSGESEFQGVSPVDPFCGKWYLKL